MPAMPIFAQPLFLAKNLARSLEAFIRSYRPQILKSSSLRSASDRGSYPELALRAALNPRLFSVFRRHPDYTAILEHVDPILGAKYLSIIRDLYGLNTSEIVSLVAPLQYLGSPRRFLLSGLPEPVSLTALRYLKVALDITHSFGSDLGHVVEVGCGYGGQSIILDKIAKLKSYTFIDIWQVNLLIRRFAEASDSSFPYSISTLREHSWQRSQWDVAISNYAFSELPEFLQRRYLKIVLSNCSAGYLTMNSGDSGAFGAIQNLSKSELLNLFPGATSDQENPLTMAGNYVLKWGFLTA